MSETVHIPQLRFPEFREEWKIVKLTDIVDVMTDYVAAGSFESLRNNVTVYDKPNYAIYLRLTDLRKGIYHKDLKYVDRSSYDFLNKSNLCGGEILMANIGANVGDTYLMPVIDDFATIAPNMIVIKENRLEFLSAFLFYWLNTRKGEKSINTAISGSGQPKINKTDLKQIKISLTSQLEQAKIASFLTAVDNKIEQLSKKKALLGEYKKGLMQQIFSQAIRFRAGDTPGQPLLPNGNSPSGSDFPNWEEKRLGDLCEITTGKLDANAMVEGGQYRFYTCAKEYYKIDDYAFDTDALIVSGNGANVGYIHHYQGKFNAYQRTYVLDSFTDNIIFVKFVLDEYLHKRIMKEKNEGNTPYIVMGTLTDMKINLPSFSEQTKIAIFLSSIDSKIEQVGKQLDESKQFKKALLQQMFV